VHSIWQRTQNLPYEKVDSSVFEGGWPAHLMSFEEHNEDEWNLVRALRDDVNKMLEIARSYKLLGASLDAAAFVYVEDSAKREIFDKLVGDESLISPLF
jgi:isoleucyl-tRNA synthetase